MGVQYSRAKAAVNSVVDAGINVVVNQINNQSSTLVAEHEIVCDGCDTCNISHVSQKMFIKVDFSAVASQLSSTEVQSDLTEKITAAADAAAKGGLGLQGADADTVINALVSVREAITTTAQSVFSQDTFLSQTIHCRNTKEGNISYIDQEMTADIVAKSITSQGSFNTAMLKLVTDIEATAKATATGYDPLGMLALIAVAVLVGLLVVVAGGSFMGVNVAQKVLKSPYFWMSMLGFVILACSTVLAGEGFGFWPKQSSDNLDTAASDATKKKINLAVTSVTGICLTASAVGLGFMVYKYMIKK
jgi:hypothetical protein